MPIHVQLPDGSIGEFPDGMKDADIEAVLQKQYGTPKTKQPAGLPSGMTLPGFPDTKPSMDMPASTAGSRLLGSGNLGDTVGVIGSHLKNLVAGPYHAFTDAPRSPEEAAIKGTGETTGPMNALGQFGLGASRMLVQPTVDALKKLPSSKSATDVMNNLTDAIPVAGGLARSIEDEAADKGAIPALFGGAVDVFAPEMVGGVLGKISKGAPSMAEGAMGIRKGDRGYGKTPGRAILDETSGVRPETVGRQAQSVLDQLNPQIEGMAANYPGTIDIAPARQSVQGEISTAKSRNNAQGVSALDPLRRQLDTNLDNGLPLSANQTGTGVLNLKRGLRDAFVKNWSPDAASQLTRDAAKNASRQLDTGLDSALGPNFAKTNQRISSLIPITDAAEKLSRADEIPQKLGDKLRAHTGALASAIAGGAAGAHSGGLLGGVGGATLGFALPELLGGPTARMAIARGMNSPIPGTLAPIVASGGALTPRKKAK